MSDPYPTKTRLALLNDVARARVYHSADNGQIMRKNDSRFPARCTAAIGELIAAGWVHLGRCDTYELTNQGYDLLRGRG